MQGLILAVGGAQRPDGGGAFLAVFGVRRHTMVQGASFDFECVLAEELTNGPVNGITALDVVFGVVKVCNVGFLPLDFWGSFLASWPPRPPRGGEKR